MRLLLDTHVLIWWDQGARLTQKAIEAIETADEVFVSAASFWEIAIKASLGRLETSRQLPAMLEENGFRELPVHIRHTAAVARLPWHHRDPFDRLLIAQAQTDRMTIVTRDRPFDDYSIKTLGA